MVVRPLLVLLGALVATAAAAGAVAACSSDVTPAPTSAEPRLCEPGVAVIPCDAGAPGAPLSCLGDPRATDDVRSLPTDKSYGVGCRMYFPQRDCTPISNCYCREDDGDAGTARWICER